ncbi:hypothetical protein P4H39_26595 [Paenibacillus lautus]|uniref:hypothetical protein n=1 Tax=Paenibacillus lautus TaxID=1401 RepID=UPI002DBD875A|nr:hypothetical protein [Paenibacillus lautus]MEC0206187.1 hypothetical protein [Paenibacillus lautus]
MNIVWKFEIHPMVFAIRQLRALKKIEKEVIHAKKKKCPSHGHGGHKDHKGHACVVKSVVAQELSVDL